MTNAHRSITGVGVANARHGLPPLEEFLSVEGWLLELPNDTVMRVQLEDGTSYLTSLERLLESARLGEVVDRFRVQLRLGRL